MPKAAIGRTSPSTFMNFRPAVGLCDLSLSRRTVGSCPSLSGHSGEKKPRIRSFQLHQCHVRFGRKQLVMPHLQLPQPGEKPCSISASIVKITI